MELPHSIPENTHIVIATVGTGTMAMSAVASLVPSYVRPGLSQTVFNAVEKGFLTKKREPTEKGKLYLYSLTKLGRKIYNNLDKVKATRRKASCSTLKLSTQQTSVHGLLNDLDNNINILESNCVQMRLRVKKLKESLT